MKYPDELYNKITETTLGIDIQDFSNILYHIKMAGEVGYKLGLEKGWQYQQDYDLQQAEGEQDNASRQWENSDE